GTFKWTSPWDNGISDFTRINMTGRTITFHIYVPAGLVDTTNPYGVKVYAQNKSWQWKDMWFNITGSGWQTYSWNVSGAYNTCQWTDCNDATEVIQIGVEITKSNASSPDFTGTLYFDEIAY
ncbi:MAG TPA: hypothetical protein P5511_05435, partial [Candidatus Goldiibacteriota bacterium]|nr:hypothetical protein [Candidatus Goldiibacteriota bacterium]